MRSGGRVPTSPQGLAILANSLRPDDQVALEAAGEILIGVGVPRCSGSEASIWGRER